MEDKSRESIDELKAKHEKEIALMKAEHEKENDEIVEVHEDLINELEDEHSNEIKQMEAKYSKVFDEVQEEHEAEIKYLQDKHEKEIKSLQEELDRLQAERSVRTLSKSVDDLVQRRQKIQDKFCCKMCNDFVRPSTLRQCVMDNCKNSICRNCYKCMPCWEKGIGLKE